LLFISQVIRERRGGKEKRKGETFLVPDTALTIVKERGKHERGKKKGRALWVNDFVCFLLIDPYKSRRRGKKRIEKKKKEEGETAGWAQRPRRVR